VASERNCFLEWIDFVNNTFESTTHKHFTVRTKRYAGRVWNVSGIFRNVAADVDTKERYRQLLATRSGTRDKKGAILRVECGVGNRMQIAGEFFPDREICRFTGLVPAPQVHLDLAALGFRNRGQHPAWPERDYLRHRLANVEGTLRWIAGVEFSALNDDLPTGYRIRRIDVHNF